MKPIDKSIEAYCELFLDSVSRAVHDEFSYLRRKHDEPPLPVITEQRENYKHVQRHTHFFDSRYRVLERRVGDIPHVKEDVLAHFFTTHNKQFINLLDKQEASFGHGKLRTKLDSFLHRDYTAYLHKEEELFSELLYLLHTKNDRIEELAKKFSRDEWYEKIREGTMLTALGSEIVLLGPLEILSVPLWGVYFGMGTLEKLSHQFDDWRHIKKHRIT